MKSQDSRSDLPLAPPPPYGSNWGHEIANFVFLPYISFILAFRALEFIKRWPFIATTHLLWVTKLARNGMDMYFHHTPIVGQFFFRIRPFIATTHIL